MRGELKKYRLRATKRPAKNPILSSTVLVRNEQGQEGYCYVNFDPPLVQAVGKKFTTGVAGDDPAYLEVVYYNRTGVWLVKAVKVRDQDEVLLWRTKTKPIWLNFYARKA